MAQHDLAAVGEFTDNGARVFSVAGRRIAVFSVGGVFYAIDDQCSHATASLSEGEVDSDELCVECPRHGARFDLRSGAARTPPAFRPVNTYQTHVQGDRLILELVD